MSSVEFVTLQRNAGRDLLVLPAGTVIWSDCNWDFSYCAGLGAGWGGRGLILPKRFFVLPFSPGKTFSSGAGNFNCGF